LPNHFHLLLRIKNQESHKTIGEEIVSRKFGDFLGTYVKALNNRYRRTVSLFEGRCQRKEIHPENQFINTLVYIHQNPQKHGYVSHFQSWPYSFYTCYKLGDPGDILSPAIYVKPLTHDSIMAVHKEFVVDVMDHDDV